MADHQQKLANERQRLENERQNFRNQLHNQVNQQQRQLIENRIQEYEQQLNRVRDQEQEAERLFIEQKRQEVDAFKQREILSQHHPSEIIDRNQLVLHERIGRGGFGEVFRASLNGQTVAVKKLKRRANVEGAMETLIDMKNESEALKKCKHPGVLEFKGVCLDQNELWIITEYVNGTDLNTFLHQKKEELSEGDILEVCSQICTAVAYMHQQLFIHRDLKSSNILIRKSDSGYQIKVADFGIAREIDWSKMSWAKYENVHSVGNLSSEAGTLLWMCPEVFFGEDYDEKCDVYSFGMVLYEIITGEYPYSPTISKDELAEILKSGGRLFKFNPDSSAYQRMNRVSISLTELVKSCVSVEKDNRPELALIMSRLERMKMEYSERKEIEVVTQSSFEESQARQMDEELHLALEISRFTAEEREFEQKKVQIRVLLGLTDEDVINSLLTIFNGDVSRIVNHYFN